MPANTVIERTIKSLKDGDIEHLQVRFDKYVDFEPGHHISRAHATSAPRISYLSASPDKTYLAICVDLDAPFRSLSFLSPILHLNQPGLKGSSSAPWSLEANEDAIASWVPPGPPPGAAPHRYMFLLFEQPPYFDTSKYVPADGKDLGLKPRVRYSLDDWKQDAGLGDVLAANYFVSN